MGHYYHSSVKADLTPERVEDDLKALNEKLWPEGTYRVERVTGASAPFHKWCFMFTDPKLARCDAAFSIVLDEHGRLEFKVPRTRWDQYWEDQQKVRRRLVRRYNKAS
jgi:hypothetical protein